MLICHCERVNDRRIREAVAEGARTVGQVGRACKAGTCCGGCVRAISEIVEAAESPVAQIAQARAIHRDLPVAKPLPRQLLPVAAE